MVVFGIFLMVLGAICEWIVDNSVTINDHSFNMDTLGVILLVLGGLSVLIGLISLAMYTNTSHVESHDVLVEEEPVVERPVVRRRKRNRRVDDDYDGGI